MANVCLVVALFCVIVQVVYVQGADDQSPAFNGDQTSPDTDALKSSAAGNDGSTKGGDQKAPGAGGNKYNWKDVKACCPHPDLFTRESRRNCSKAMKAAKAERAESQGNAGEEPEAAGNAKAERGCSPECNAKYLNMVNEKGELDMGEIEKRLAALEANNTQWNKIITTALTTCSPTIATSVKPDQKCKSGANELKNCIVNQMLINCPIGVKADTPQCSEIIARKQQQARRQDLKKAKNNAQG